MKNITKDYAIALGVILGIIGIVCFLTGLFLSIYKG